MSQSWTICMGDYPDGFSNARLLVATFQGLAMVVESDGYPPTFTVILAAEDGLCPVEVTPIAFAEVAVYQSHTTRPKPLLVLRRVDVARPFDRVGFCDAPEAVELTSQLRGEA